MEWNQMKIDACYAEIEAAKSVEGGLFEAKKKGLIDPDVSENALRKAASRYGYQTPRQFLARVSGENEAVLEPIQEGALESVLINSKLERKTELYWKRKATEAATYLEQVLTVKSFMNEGIKTGGADAYKRDGISTHRFNDELPEIAGQSTLTFVVSDIHIGKLFDSNNTNNYTSYNAKVAEWFEQQTRQIFKMIRDRASKNVGRIIYAALGDNFESFFGNMREGQHMTMDSLALEQYRKLVNLHKRLIQELTQLFPEVPITAVFMPGNHDRLMESKDWDSEFILNYFLVERIATEFDKKHYPNLEFIAGKHVVSLLTSQGTELLFHHGHHSSVKTEEDLINFTRIHGNKTSKRYVVCQGHLHHFKALSAGRDTLGVWSPSFVPADDYSLFKLNKNSSPGVMAIEHTSFGDMIIGPLNFKA